MKILIITHKPCNTIENKVYSTGGFVKVVGSLGEKFEEVRILSPQNQSLTRESSDYLKNGKFKHTPISSNLVKMPIDIVLKLFKLRKGYDVIQVRMPSIPSTIALVPLLFFKSKIFIYLGGDFTKTIKYKYKDSKYKTIYIFLSSLIEKISLLGIKNYPTFVTGSELYNKYSLLTKKIYKVRSTSLSADEIKCSKKLNRNESLTICLIGRLSEEKGIKFFLDDIYPRLATKYNLKINIVGDGPLKNYVENFNSDIVYYGSVYDRKKLLNILRKSDLMALNSITEGTPKVLLESMSQGTPVIATDVGGIPNIINNSENGMLYKPLDHSDFINKFNELINSNLYEKISINGIKYSKNNTLEELNREFLSKI